MDAPGYTVTIGNTPAVSFTAPGTSNGFMAGFVRKPTLDEPKVVFSLTDFAEKCGGRITGNPHLYDSVDTAFREGASAIYIAPIQGDGAAAATKDLIDGASKVALTVTAVVPGDWGNDLKLVATAAGGKYTLTLSYEGTVIAVSPSLEDLDDAVAWAAEAASDWITIVNPKTPEAANPKTQTIELEDGDDDFTAVDDDNLETALDLFNRDLGPGQVAAPGFTDAAMHEKLLAHAAANNRRALIDLEDGATPEELAEAAVALSAVPDEAARFGAALAPWATVPGLSSSTTRTVPYSAVQMGLIARAEGAGHNPNEAAAGKKRGSARFATGLTQAFTDAQRATLNDAGVISAILVRGVVTTFGNRTLVNSTEDSNWKSFSASRLVMAVAAEAGRVLEDFEFSQIDGHGYVFKELEGELNGRACIPFYLANALYGTTPAEAFVVNTGPDVNTPTSIEAEEIKAQIALRVSPTGERLNVEIVKVSANESL